jgi:hypothetical protein
MGEKRQKCPTSPPQQVESIDQTTSIDSSRRQQSISQIKTKEILP